MASDASNVSHRTHYARLGHASQNLIPKMLQKVLLHYEKPATLYARCCRDQYIAKTLNREEQIKLYNATSKGYANFDIPLVYKILRNVSKVTPPTKGWNHPQDPDSHDTTIGDDLERCRRTRNYIIHRGNTAVSDEELDEYFKTFKDIAGRFEQLLSKKSGKFISKFMKLKTCWMDEEKEKMYYEHLEKLAHKAKDMEEMFLESIRNLEISKEKDSELISRLEEDLDRKPNDNESREDHILELENILKQREKASRQTVTHCAGCIKALSKTKELNEDREPSLVELRPYQQELARQALNGENTIVVSGTNTGKTHVAFHVIDRHLVNNPEGTVVFINKTKLLLKQQYDRACNIFYNLNFQGKIFKWDATEEEVCEPFAAIVKRVRIFFCTPTSLCNHLAEKAESKVTLDDFTLIVLDECHHVVGNNPFNEIMKYYRRHKYRGNPDSLPQILGLTASPGTNNAISEAKAVEHLKTLMTNMDVKTLSTVREHESDLLEFTSTPKKETVRSRRRSNDPVEKLLLQSIHEVEHMFSITKIQDFLLKTSPETRIILKELRNAPKDKSSGAYVQWIALTKEKIENVMIDDTEVPCLLHTCMRYLEVFTDCLEINSLLEIEQVKDLIQDAYENQADQLQNSEDYVTLLRKLKDVHLKLTHYEIDVENNPDVEEIIQTLEQEYGNEKENSRFLIFVKKRATAKALAKRLPSHFRAHHLTGKRPEQQHGLKDAEQEEVLEKFRDGFYLCLVATSVASEGIDIPQCNLVIRYKFRTNEISSYQMRGRIRHRQGKEVVIDSNENLETESLNILRQYHMEKAIEHIMDMDIENDIVIAERAIFDREEYNRLKAEEKLYQKQTGDFVVHCKPCGQFITDGHLLRHINGIHYIVYDKHIFSRIDCVPFTKGRSFDKINLTGKALGKEENERKCGHPWGTVLVYKGCKFLALAKTSISCFEPISKKGIPFRKWQDFKYAVKELSDTEVEEYKFAF